MNEASVLSEATARPWRLVTEEANASIYRGVNFYICAEGELPDSQIARVNIQDGLNEQAANAALIVRAVNSHEALVAVLEEAVANNMIVEGSEWWGRVYAALARAKQ